MRDCSGNHVIFYFHSNVEVWMNSLHSGNSEEKEEEEESDDDDDGDDDNNNNNKINKKKTKTKHNIPFQFRDHFEVTQII